MSKAPPGFRQDPKTSALGVKGLKSADRARSLELFENPQKSYTLFKAFKVSWLFGFENTQQDGNRGILQATLKVDGKMEHLEISWTYLSSVDLIFGYGQELKDLFSWLNDCVKLSLMLKIPDAQS